MRRAAVVMMLLLPAGPAVAQSTYVAGAVGVDVFRPARVDARGVENLAAGGEAVAFSLRVGTAITDRWGVDLELSRPREIERETRRGGPIPLPVGQPVPSAIVVVPDGVPLPIVESTTRFERRNTTLGATAWVAQTLSGPVDLVYLGGVAFNRVVEEVHTDFVPPIFPARRLLLPLPLVRPGSTRTTTYGVGPVVGVDARLSLTDHVMLVPGLRLQGVGGSAAGGWRFRSSVGIGWKF